MSNYPIKVGIVGLGRWAKVLTRASANSNRIKIVAAFSRDSGNAAVPLEAKPLPLSRLEWEHIQKVLTECGGNISETARRLGMHRRTLQRKLAKRPSRK